MNVRTFTPSPTSLREGEGKARDAGWARLENLAADRLWLRPLGLLCGRAAADAVASGLARPLAGFSLAFGLVAAIGLGSDRRLASVTASVAELESWLAGAGRRFADRARDRLALLSAPRPPWAGLALDRPLIMGVLNVTPDSFSDGGRWFDVERAVAQGRALVAQHSATVGAHPVILGGKTPQHRPFGDDRAVRATYVAGECVYDRDRAGEKFRYPPSGAAAPT